MSQRGRWRQHRGIRRGVGASAALAIVVTGFLLVARIFGGGPAAVAQAFLNAVAARDLEQARRFLAPEARSVADADLQSVVAPGEAVAVGKSQITSRYARVDYVTDGRHDHVALRRHEGGWRVYGVGETVLGGSAPFPTVLQDLRPPQNEPERVARQFLTALVTADRDAAVAQLTAQARQKGRDLLAEHLAVWRERAEAGLRFDVLLSESKPIESAGADEFLVKVTLRPVGGFIEVVATQGAYQYQIDGQSGELINPAQTGTDSGAVDGKVDEDPRLAEARARISGSIDRGPVLVYLRKEQGGWRVRACTSQPPYDRGQGQSVFPLTVEEVQERSIVRDYEDPGNRIVVAPPLDPRDSPSSTGGARILIGHTGPVTSVAFAPLPSRLVATASRDKTLRLWDAKSGEALAMLEGHTGGVNDVAFSPDGASLASASSDWTVRLWEAATGSPQMTLLGHVNTVHSVAFVTRGASLVSGSWDSTVRVWDLATGKPVSNLAPAAYDYVSYTVAVSPDGKKVATDGVDHAVVLRDLETASAVALLKGHTDWVTSVAFSPDGATLASSSKDHTIKLWDVASLTELRTLKGHTAGVMSVDFSADGAWLVSGGQDNRVMVWELPSGRQHATFEGHAATVRSVTFSPDGATVASASDDHTARFWRVPRGGPDS